MLCQRLLLHASVLELHLLELFILSQTVGNQCETWRNATLMILSWSKVMPLYFRYVFLVLHARPRISRSSDHIYRGVLSSIRPSIVCSGGLCFPSDPPYLEYIRIHTSNIRVHTSKHTDTYRRIRQHTGYIWIHWLPIRLHRSNIRWQEGK